jgi:hypothetical protein
LHKQPFKNKPVSGNGKKIYSRFEKNTAMSLLSFGTHFYLELVRMLLVVYLLACTAILLLRAPYIGHWLRGSDEAVRKQAAEKILPLTRRIAYGLIAVALVSVLIVVLTMIQYKQIMGEFPGKMF